tara:strand:+ start:55 stop:576 length:522 start_codon:yes stop_codon:yes gene_type:complete
MILRLIFIFYILTISSVFAHDAKKKKSLKSHEHGVGVLKIAQENKILFFQFEMPGNDIVGFEYEADKEEDKIKVKNALTILEDFKNMAVPSNNGECENIKSDAKIIIEGNHSEFVSEYKFNCKNVSNLKRIYIKYFDNFELTKKLNIKILGINKKAAYVIGKNKKMINVKEHF